MHVTILGVNYAPETTGIAPYTTGLASGLTDAGHHVSVITSYPHYPQWRVADGYSGLHMHDWQDGVELHRVRPYIPRSATGLRRAVFEATFGIEAAAVRTGPADVLICVTPALIGSLLALIRHARRGSPAVGIVVQDLYGVGLRETGSVGSFTSGIFKRAEGRLLRSAAGVVAIHERMKRRMVDDLGVDADRVRVIPNWTHVQTPTARDRGAFRAALGWGPEEVVVLHAGAMGVKQGLNTVVEAARESQHRRSPVRFVLMGDGSQRSGLEEQARGLANITFVDPLPNREFTQALVAADVLLVSEAPWLAEMCVPSKLTSYFSAGRPVLAAVGEGGITADELRRAGAGVVCEPGSPIALLSAAERLGSSSAASDLGAAGARYCAEVLSASAAQVSYNQWVVDLANEPKKEG